MLKYINIIYVTNIYNIFTVQKMTVILLTVPDCCTIRAKFTKQGKLALECNFINEQMGRKKIDGWFTDNAHIKEQAQQDNFHNGQCNLPRAVWNTACFRHAMNEWMNEWMTEWMNNEWAS